MRKPLVRTCKNCNKEYTTKEYRSTFCSRSCAATFNNIDKNPPSSEARKKISDSLKEFWKNNPNKIRKGQDAIDSGIASSKGKHKKPTQLLDLSSRTVQKILSRLNIGCSLCGWKEAACDIHHINGRKIEDPHNHRNLTYVCPNCHRLIHSKKIDKDKIVNLEDFVGDKWKEYYFG